MNTLAAVSRLLSRVTLYAAAVGLIGMTAIICWQVFARYVLSAPPSWTEQAALFLMLWFILFAAAAGVREGFHIRLTLLQDSLKPKPRTWLRLLCHALVGLFGVAMAMSGAGLVSETWSHTIPTLNIPRGLAYLPMVFTGALIAFFAAEHVITEAQGGEVDPAWS